MADGLSNQGTLPERRHQSRDQNGWYVFRDGEEVRCPQLVPHQTKPHVLVRCSWYFLTVSQGVVYLRAETVRSMGERRTHPRSSRRCDKCKTPYEWETVSEERHA